MQIKHTIPIQAVRYSELMKRITREQWIEHCELHGIDSTERCLIAAKNENVVIPQEAIKTWGVEDIMRNVVFEYRQKLGMSGAVQRNLKYGARNPVWDRIEGRK